MKANIDRKRNDIEDKMKLLLQAKRCINVGNLNFYFIFVAGNANRNFDYENCSRSLARNKFTLFFSELFCIVRHESTFVKSKRGNEDLDLLTHSFVPSFHLISPWLLRNHYVFHASRFDSMFPKI